MRFIFRVCGDMRDLVRAKMKLGIGVNVMNLGSGYLRVTSLGTEGLRCEWREWNWS